MFLIALLETSLLGQFGWRGCNRVMAFLCLACALFGLVMVPTRKKTQESENNNNVEVEVAEKSSLKILRNIPFLLMTLANIPNAMAIYISYTYLPSVCTHIAWLLGYAIAFQMAHQAGLSTADASFLISVVGVSNTVGRIFSGWLADLKSTSALGITIITAAAG